MQLSFVHKALCLFLLCKYLQICTTAWFSMIGFSHPLDKKHIFTPVCRSIDLLCYCNKVFQTATEKNIDLFILFIMFSIHGVRESY